VSFKNTIVVMTSNLGSVDILDTMTALDADLLRERVMQQVRRQHKQGSQTWESHGALTLGHADHPCTPYDTTRSTCALDAPQIFLLNRDESEYQE